MALQAAASTHQVLASWHEFQCCDDLNQMRTCNKTVTTSG